MKTDEGKGENKKTEDTTDPEKEDVQVLEEHSSPETSSRTVTDASSPQMPRDDDSVQEIPSDEETLPPKKRVLCL